MRTYYVQVTIPGQRLNARASFDAPKLNAVGRVKNGVFGDRLPIKRRNFAARRSRLLYLPSHANPPRASYQIA